MGIFGAKWGLVEQNGESMLLTGSYKRSLDEKMRLAIPKQLRDAIGYPDRNDLFLTPGTEQSLAIHTAETLQNWGQRLEQQAMAAPETRAFSRLFYAQAQPAEIDGQGRVRIPTELAQFAKLSDEVMLLGVRDHMEIWSTEAWQKFLTESQARYDELAARAFQASTS